MKDYDLSLHWKQGDDFRHHLKETQTISEALRSWAKDFLKHAETCEKVAVALENLDVHIDADTHMIRLSTSNRQTGKVLANLERQKLIYAVEYG